ncbi:hypothetical protein QBC33DRAFT_183599 [Phialemonium atrogriseum]|uniref:Uncharacterized protein n=1 Tax=Phialemonium atrogriseum TaxID=1093897 RepID=A0AAJ0FJS9_9PEZI|nr:uncharacterized protein QBC33DRAFT_183599 [Phialemonium atrogriseum]KAK1764789.1 hypothetical protein QBC33DRAFT_183599 [Phialemonium atrogriseum]
MAPIRRYLRITKYSVLECRIYLDNPALAQSWLLNPRDPVLPRVIDTVRPLVLPKLREEKERERSRKKGAKKRNIKDVVTADDFEVSIFLTETNTRHSLLYKHKHFRDKTQTKLTSNSTKLTGASSEAPIDVDGGFPVASDETPALRREESDDNDAIILDDIPAISEPEIETDLGSANRPSKRRRRGQPADDGGGEGSDNGGLEVIESDLSADGSDDDGAGSAGSDSESWTDDQPPSKRRKEGEVGRDSAARDDKKKLAMDISYEGFAIYGRVLCLVVKRRGTGGGGSGSGGRGGTSVSSLANKSQTGPPAGQAMMENWITSTQMPTAAEGDELERRDIGGLSAKSRG